VQRVADLEAGGFVEREKEGRNEKLNRGWVLPSRPDVYANATSKPVCPFGHWVRGADGGVTA